MNFVMELATLHMLLPWEVYRDMGKGVSSLGREGSAAYWRMVTHFSGPTSQGFWRMKGILPWLLMWRHRGLDRNR